MKLATHLHLAELIYDAFEKDLNKLFFKIGNTLPDLLPNMRVRSHTEKHSMDFVHKKINKLVEKKHTKRFVLSIRLGIVSHFLSDFCCAPHMPNYDGSLIDHRKHEVSLTDFHGKYHEEFAESVKHAKSAIEHVLSSHVVEDTSPYQIQISATKAIPRESAA